MLLNEISSSLPSNEISLKSPIICLSCGHTKENHTLKCFGGEWEKITSCSCNKFIPLTIGQIVLCYDSRIWYKRGYDWNHNEDCWKKATIFDIRFNVMCCKGMDDEYIYDILIDVIFEYDHYLSKGHFLSSIKQI